MASEAVKRIFALSDKERNTSLHGSHKMEGALFEKALVAFKDKQFQETVSIWDKKKKRKKKGQVDLSFRLLYTNNSPLEKYPRDV